MPFTFAHPAAVVPLLRPLGRHAVFSALVIGSMVPDFSYFLPFPVARRQSHDLLGLFWFCLPAGALSYALFHGVLAAPLVDLLPTGPRLRCAALFVARARPAISAVAFSLFVGSLTHIAWDAFTHAGAPIVRVSRALRLHLWTVSGYPISVFTILQHLSTAIGLVLIAMWAARWLRETPAPQTPPPAALGSAGRWIALASIVAVAAGFWIASGTIGPPRESTLRGVQFALRRAVPTGIAAVGAAVTLYALTWQIWARASGRALRRPAR